MIDYDGCVGVQVTPDNPDALLHFFIKMHQICLGEDNLKYRKLKNKQMELELSCIKTSLNPDLHITGGNWHIRNNLEEVYERSNR